MVASQRGAGLSDRRARQQGEMNRGKSAQHSCGADFIAIPHLPSSAARSKHDYAHRTRARAMPTAVYGPSTVKTERVLAPSGIWFIAAHEASQPGSGLGRHVGKVAQRRRMCLPCGLPQHREASAKSMWIALEDASLAIVRDHPQLLVLHDRNPPPVPAWSLSNSADCLPPRSHLAAELSDRRARRPPERTTRRPRRRRSRTRTPTARAG